MPAATQENRQLVVKTPLGKDKLMLSSFTGREEISRLFVYKLEMISGEEHISPERLLGKNVSFGIRLSDDSFRWFNGFVSRFSGGSRASGWRQYQAEIVPWPWFLTQTADCRIFQEKTVPQIIEQIFKDLGFSDFDTSQIKENHDPWEYCVQYRETDFNFVSRLMEQEGIFYFFRHEDGKHTMVLGDQKNAFENCPEREVQYERSRGTIAREDRISEWAHEYAYTPGKWAQSDYNFIDHPHRGEKTPAKLLLTAETSAVKLDGNDKLEVYDYPGGYPDKLRGGDYTMIRMQEDEVPHDTARGGSICRTFTLGGKLKIKRHDWKEEEGKTYVITAIEHTATEAAEYGGGEGIEKDYENSFACIPDSVTFRPRRSTPKPVIQGSQTAVVVGPPGEEIWPDKHGRVKVQFPWDREGERDEKTSCWIRCAQSAAGKGWGSMFIPRVGQEVVVSHLEGDPDRPLITGLVYNADQMPAYKLPDEKTKSYIKTNSSQGGSGYNELRFEDKADNEQIFMHAQKNMETRVLNDSLERIHRHRHQIIGDDQAGDKQGDQKELVYGLKHLTVHGDDQTHIGGDMKLLVGGIEGDGNQDIVIRADKKELVKGAAHLHVNGNRNEKVDMDQSLTVGMNQQEKVGMSHALESGMDIHLKAGMNVVIEAGLSLTLKGPGGFVNISPAGIAIQGNLVTVNSGGAAGVGAGASPTEPTDAAEAAPDEPQEADDSESGQRSTPF